MLIWQNSLRLNQRWLKKALICLIFFSFLAAVPSRASGPPPVIVVQPLGVSVLLNDSVTFLVVATSGTTLSYQWQRNGTNVPGATAASYFISSVQPGDQGTYTVKVTNAGGTVTSSSAVLLLSLPPGITSQPQDQAVAVGQTPAFSLVVSGTAPFTYQWFFKGKPLPGQTNYVCTIANAQLSDSGAYTVSVTNAAGVATSSNAQLTVVNPVITVDNTSSASTNNATLTWPHTVGAGDGRILMVGVAVHNSGRSVTSATFAGQNLTFIGQSLDGNGKVEVDLYQLLAPPVGTANVTITIDSSDRMSGGAVSFNGVSQRAPLGSYISAGSSGSTGGSVSLVSSTNEIVFSLMGATGDALSLAPAGYQISRWNRASGTSGNDAISASSTLVGTAASTNSWSLGVSKPWALGAVALKPLPPLALQADVFTTQAGPTNVIAGANYVCLLAVTNAGPGVATNIVLAEALPAGVAIFNVTGGAVSNNGVVTWPSFNLASGTGTSFTLTLTAPAVGTLTHTVSSTADTYDPNVTNNDGSAAVANVILTVTPQGSPGLVAATTVYATNVATKTWSHAVPNGNNRLLLVSFAFAENNKTVSSVTYNGVNLAFAGRSAVNQGVEIWSLVNPPVGTANIIATWSSGEDCVLWSASFTNVNQTSPLGLFQAANGQSLTPGMTVSTDVGNAVVDVLSAEGSAITQTPGTGQTIIASGATGTGGSNARGAGSYKAAGTSTTMSWTLGASKKWDLGVVTVNAATPVQADVVTTQSGVTGVLANSNLTYTITVTNAGPATASGLVVSDILPAGAIFVNASGGGLNAGGIVSWAIASLPYAAKTNFTVTVTAPSGGLLTNTVFSTATTSDPNAANNNGTAVAATIVTLVYAPPVITTQPQPQSLALMVGQQATFNVAATGSGPLTYQWIRNGTPLSGATNATFILAAVQTNATGAYAVLVTNAVGYVFSTPATLTVTNPVITMTVGSGNSVGMTTAGFGFELSLPMGCTYVIDASVNLRDWTPIATNVAATGTITFIDPVAVGMPWRYYRAYIP